jgi:prevent-host-death family protein
MLLQLHLTGITLCAVPELGKVVNITTYHYYQKIQRIQMETAISAAEANRNFSRILRDVRDGHSFIVTSHGKPVARLVPVHQNVVTRAAARDALLTRLRQQPIVHIGRWTRDELYEDED